MEAYQVVTALNALAHEHRLAVYRFLVKAGPDGVPAGAIADHVGLVPSSTAFHLRALLHAGLVSQRRVSRQVFYAMVPAVMNDLVIYLTEHCCGGVALCAPACEPSAASARRPRKPAAA